ncbi:MAG: NYN domain-containing protein [Treponema sp.]|jgi:uncharacterized LabA/DUF88 family protein|nr:NYN domain-containing protein [Treponema sp.]
MAPRKKSIVKIGIFYDGSYFYKVSNYYKFDHARKARISISGLHNFIKNEIAEHLEIDQSLCKIEEAHYFRGRAVRIDNDKAIIGERYFEDALMKDGVKIHHLPLMRGPNFELKEKGIDVHLALEAYKSVTSKKIDILALVAGDGDYLPLVDELDVDVMLVSWDFTTTLGEVTITSQDLLEKVEIPIQMAKIIDDRIMRKSPLVNALFEFHPAPEVREPGPAYEGAAPAPQTEGRDINPMPSNISPFVTSFGQSQIPPQSAPGIIQSANFGAPGAFAPRRRLLSEAELAEEKQSTIMALGESGGWIRDYTYNNYFFFYDDVVNCSREELDIGMKVRFYLRFDPKKAEKENGEPSYRAIGPIYVE